LINNLNPLSSSLLSLKADIPYDSLGGLCPGLNHLVMECPEEAGMTKADIRILSKEMNLPTWNKPAFACLSSRFPYGQKITPGAKTASPWDRARSKVLFDAGSADKSTAKTS